MGVLEELVKEYLITGALGMMRIVGALTALSFLGPNVLGGALARNAIAVALALAVYPLVGAQLAAVSLSAFVLSGIAMKEFLLGLVSGAFVMVLFWAIQGVGNFIDNQRGATMASSADPLVGAQSSPLALFMTQSMVAVFFAAGIFLTFLEGLYTSYAVWPVSSFYPVDGSAAIDLAVAQFALAVELVVLVGGPVVIAMFLSELGLGFVGRFAPQLNVFFLAMPVKSAVASLMLVFTWGGVVLFFSDRLSALDVVALLRTVLKDAL